MRGKLDEYWVRFNLWVDRKLGIDDTTYEEWENDDWL